GAQRALVCLDPRTGRRRRFDTRDGLPSAFVYSLVEDPAGHLWAGTNRGLVRFDPLAARPSFRAYAPADGLQSPEFNAGAALRAADGTLYAGGVAGLNRFTLATVADDPRGPAVALTGVETFDEPYDPG